MGSSEGWARLVVYYPVLLIRGRFLFRLDLKNWPGGRERGSLVVMLLKSIRIGPRVKPVRSEGRSCTSPSSTSIAGCDWFVSRGGELKGSGLAPESNIFGYRSLARDASLVHSSVVDRGGSN